MKKLSSNQQAQDFPKALRDLGGRVSKNLIAALLIWLFGLLIFLPLASSINEQVKIICSLIIIIAFSTLVFGIISDYKKLIDAFSVFPAKKFLLTKYYSLQEAELISKQGFYIFSSVILYLFYFPFLNIFHPALSGIVLLLEILFVFFLILKIGGLLSKGFMEWISR